jgi:hypothetical protein
MSEFINCKGEFRGWKNKEKKRRRLLDALAPIIVGTVVHNFGSVVVLDDWAKINREYALAENDFQPYALAGWSCVQRALEWCKDHAYQTPLFIFERGDKHQEELKRRVKKDFGVIIRTALKKPDKRKPNELPVVQLQSADFAAWQMLNLMRSVEGRYTKQREVRAALEPWLWEIFRDSFASIPNKHTRFTLESIGSRKPTLIRLCTEHQIPRRAEMSE